jgi:hypothetical protein
MPPVEAQAGIHDTARARGYHVPVLQADVIHPKVHARRQKRAGQLKSGFCIVQVKLEEMDNNRVRHA